MKRQSGVLCHISSLNGDYSVGSFGKEAKKFIDVISSLKFSVWQVLPFCYPDETGSPYKSFGAFSGNPFFIDLETLYQKGLLTQSELQGARQTSPYLCEFERLKTERVPLLKKAFSRFKDFSQVEKFMKAHEQIDKFCLFMALKEKNGYKTFNEWTDFTPLKETLEFWQFVEYEFFTEWLDIKAYANEKGVSVIGDMPIYVDYDSADLYFNPLEFKTDKDLKLKKVAGVPPDYFSEDGQLWGNPLYNFSAMKKNGYKWWQQRMEFYAEFFDGVRIDHFRAFESYYEIKAGEKTAKNGKWVKGPGLPFVNVLKKAGKDLFIIAEDLGVITDKVKQLVDKSGLPGMRVFQFAFSGGDSPHLIHNYSKNSVAYTGTHDNNTLLGYVWELGDNRRAVNEYLGLGDCDGIVTVKEIIRQMFASHSSLVVLPVQDLLYYGADTRLNTPGVAKNNWAYRLTDQAIDKLENSYEFRRYNELYGRSAD